VTPQSQFKDLLPYLLKSIALNQRFYSLDVFRGATVCLMILVNNPGSWAHIYAPLKHAPWHGLTPTDLVFPFFLFAVGNALSFVMPKLETAGPATFWKKVLKRTALIFLIGLFLNWWPFVKADDYSFKVFENIRIMGVLQRIALAYFFAAVIAYYFKGVKSFYMAMLLLLGYWALCLVGNPADPYSLEGWFGTAIDKAILGVTHLYKGEGKPFDPEGLMSTMPAISQVLLGYLVGSHIKEKGSTKESVPFMLNGLFIAAIALLVTGFCWDMVMPINKKIWTSSYVVYTTGLAILTLATMIYFIEIKGVQSKICSFFDVFGKNALFVFALSAFLPKGLALHKIEKGVTPWNWLYKKVLIHVPGLPENGSLLYAICIITVMWFICWVLDLKRIYIKV
jgi:predicted acyltransferase